MRFFSLLDFRYMVLALLLGLVSLLSVYIIWGAYSYLRNRRMDETFKREGHAAPNEEKTEHNPVHPFLIFLYIFIFFFGFAYWIFQGIFGYAIGG